MTLINAPFVGIGLYNVPEAARLSDVAPARIRRWLRGYRYRQVDETKDSPPVWESQVPVLDGRLGLSFLDLMEVRFIDAFLRAGVPWRTIRKAAQHARELLGQDHPFSTRQFQTDGHTIFADVVQHTGETHLLDLAKSQYAFRRVISQSLYVGVDFDDLDQAARWWPMGKRHQVVVDPERQFGQPIVSERNVPTAVIANAVEVEGSIRAASKWYGVAESAIRDAVKFEESLAA